MAAITITLTDRCELHGGNGMHLTFTASGAKDLVIGNVSRDDLLNEPLSDEEAVAFIKALVKLGKIGRTNLQVRNLFEAGVTVTL